MIAPEYRVHTNFSTIVLPDRIGQQGNPAAGSIPATLARLLATRRSQFEMFQCSVEFSAFAP